ncbi:MAG: ClpXP protease specificity-enhancing factor [Rubrivivax sp.]|nr:ClpXP protease specificity-enhancing factor [Rubrivivax sp.]
MGIPESPQGSSTRPYLLRALHEWCTDNGFTPYIAVHVDASVRVPPEYVKNNEIVLNIGFEATSALQLGNEFIEFKARFGGAPREIVVPVDHVVAIYARENGQGMAFPMPTAGSAGAGEGSPAAPTAGSTPAQQRAAPAASTSPSSPKKTLRLARRDAAPTEPQAAGAAPAGPGSDGEPQPPGPAAPRPSLKRIK